MAPDEDRPKRDEGSVLSPDELDISDDERVVELEEGRFVVSSDQGPPAVSGGSSTPDPESGGPRRETDPNRQDPGPSDPERRSSSERSTSPPDDRSVELTEEVVRKYLRDHVSGMNSQYGFQITAKFDDKTRQQQLVSDDVVTVFESLLLWYGQQLDSQTAVEEVLGILLMEANVPVRYPTESLKAYLARHDLGPDDSIGDLLETTQDGFEFPPQTDR